MQAFASRDRIDFDMRTDISKDMGLQHTLDHMIEGCQIISLDYKYLYINGAAARQGRKPVKQLLGRSMKEVYPGIEQTGMFRHLKQCMKHHTLQRMENEFDFPNGGKGWFELRMEPVPEGVLILSEDITKRKTAEQDIVDAMEELKETKEEIDLEKITDQAILESLGEGLIVIDARGRIIMVNGTAERLLGYKAGELKGLAITELPMLNEEGVAIPASRRPIIDVLGRGASIGPSFAGNYFVHNKRGKFPVGLTATPLKLNGKIIGAIELFRDITKEQEIDRAKTEFVSIASHQLRTPLGLTKWYLEAIQQESLDALPNIIRSYFDEICKSNERVLKVVRELLSVSRIDQGHVKDDPKDVDVEKLLKDIAQAMLPMAVAKRIGLLVDVGERLPALSVDEMRLHEVLQNLVTNALEYTPSGGHVTVSANTKGGRLAVSVADTGIGIAEEDKDKLFTKFFRSEKAALENPDGSGLGLYVVRSYVEGWGGTIVVDSLEGKGTTFTITLPYKEEEHEKDTHS